MIQQLQTALAEQSAKVEGLPRAAAAAARTADQAQIERLTREPPSRRRCRSRRRPSEGVTTDTRFSGRTPVGKNSRTSDRKSMLSAHTPTRSLTQRYCANFWPRPPSPPPSPPSRNMSSQDAHLALCTAYGARGVPKLIESLRSADADDPSPTRTALTTLHSLLSTQENKCAVVASEDAVALLTAQLAAPDEGCRRLAALVIGALALMLQGRIAVREAAPVGVLAGSAGGADGVRGGEQQVAGSRRAATAVDADGARRHRRRPRRRVGDDAAGVAALGILDARQLLASTSASCRPRRGLMAILCAVVGAKASSPQLYPALQTL